MIGLLQTPAYAQCVFGSEFSTGAELSDEDQERAVAARAGRRSALHDESKRFTLIMTEGALRWQAGSPTVMSEQVDAIVDASRIPSVRIGIIPWTTRVGVFPRHGFHIYDAVTVIVGLETATATITADRDVALFAQLFTQLERLACFDEQARQELVRIRNDYCLLA